MKILIIARVSTEHQQLESQIEKLINEAKRLGYEDKDITVISGKESGIKLDIEERQTIQQMKEHIETGQYDMVLIWEVSRLARRPKVLYEVREYLIEKHVNLRCMTPSFTMFKDDFTIDPTASIVFAIFGTMAEEEVIFLYLFQLHYVALKRSFILHQKIHLHKEVPLILIELLEYSKN